MIDDIVKIVQLIWDRDKWSHLSEMMDHLSRRSNAWKKEISAAKATFKCAESYKVGPFLNNLMANIRKSGVAEQQVNRFVRIFNELMENAFRHGCNEKKKGTVKVVCFFCRWFIHLEVKDPGKGFDLKEQLEAATVASKGRGVAHGLHVVDSLAYDVYNNGSTVGVILNGQSSYEAIPIVERIGDNEILAISVLSENAWYEMVTDWSPLIKIIENAQQSLFLIDLTEINWPSKTVWDVVERVTNYPSKSSSKFAFLISPGAHYSFGMKRYEDEVHPPIFKEDQREDAVRWLAE